MRIAGDITTPRHRWRFPFSCVAASPRPEDASGEGAGEHRERADFDVRERTSGAVRCRVAPTDALAASSLIRPVAGVKPEDAATFRDRVIRALRRNGRADGTAEQAAKSVACSLASGGLRGVRILFASLDPEQRAAAMLPDGPALIIAPAGSGKTTTLIARLGVLLTRSVPPDRIGRRHLPPRRRGRTGGPHRQPARAARARRRTCSSSGARCRGSRRSSVVGLRLQRSASCPAASVPSHAPASVSRRSSRSAIRVV